MYQNDWIPVLGEVRAPVLPQSPQCSRPGHAYAVKVMKAGMNYGWALAEENKLNLFTVY